MVNTITSTFTAKSSINGTTEQTRRLKKQIRPDLSKVIHMESKEKSHFRTIYKRFSCVNLGLVDSVEDNYGIFGFLDDGDGSV